MSITDLATKIDGLVNDVSTLSTAVDDFIKSDETLFQALKDALAANDPATIDALIAQIDAARSALTATKDKVVAADAADELPAPPV